MNLIKSIPISSSIMRTVLSLSVPALLVTAGNYAAFAQRVATTISLDVNPSIEITANESDEVIEIKALNEDAETIIEDLDLESVDLDVAMHVIVGSMVRNGYIDEEKNAVLLAVENEDEAKQQELEALVMSEINDRLAVSGISPLIFSQTTENGAEVKAFAKRHDISVNKAAFILKMLEENDGLSEERLVAMNVESLSEVIRSKHLDLHDSVAYSDKALTNTPEKTSAKTVKKTDKQTVTAVKETEKKVDVAVKAPESQMNPTENQVAAEYSPTVNISEPTNNAGNGQAQAAEKQAAADAKAAEKQAEANAKAVEAQAQAVAQQAAAAAKAAEKQAEAEAKAKEEQIQAAEKQAEADAREAEKQAKEAEKQAEADAKALEKQANGNGNGNGNSNGNGNASNN